MKNLEKLKLTFKKPLYSLVFLNNRGVHLLNDELYLKLLFRLKMGYRLDLNNPQTFNEKLQWLKLNDHKDIYTTMVDKHEVKKYVADVLGEEYIIPTLGVYEKFDDIDFNKLPKQFVIKCTHDSGGLVVCKDKSKLNLNEARKKINKCMKRNFYWSGREWPYKGVKPRILIEQYMEDSKEKELKDYKFFCFNGKVHCFKIDFDRFVEHHANYYNKKGKLLKFGEIVCPPNYNKELKMPILLNKMIKLAEILSKDTYFARIDFYCAENKIYFGEITFYPAAGFGKFAPDEWDKKLGKLIRLPCNKTFVKEEKK